MARIKPASFLLDSTNILQLELSPEHMLVVAIFYRAFMDCRDKTKHDDLRKFARSRWAQMLLEGAADADFVAKQFDEIISLYA